MTTLRDARKNDKLPEFIAHREAEGQPEGCEHKFNRVLQAMAQSSKSGRETLKRDRSGD